MTLLFLRLLPVLAGAHERALAADHPHQPVIGELADDLAHGLPGNPELLLQVRDARNRQPLFVDAPSIRSRRRS